MPVPRDSEYGTLAPSCSGTVTSGGISASVEDVNPPGSATISWSGSSVAVSIEILAVWPSFLVNMAIEHANSAAYQVALGDLAGARAAAREAVRFGRHAQDAFVIAIVLQHWALLAALSGQVDSAARLLGFVEAQFKKLEYTRETTEAWGFEKLMDVLREHRNDAEIEKLEAEGAMWSEDRAIEELHRDDLVC
jgi:hypothetical protein